MQENLVIVESPAKAKKIEEYLGKDYKVMSSYGHIRDLKKRELSINEQTMEPDYEIPEEKKKLVTELKSAAKKAKKIWLASDEDREGEAISWHLCEVLGLDEEKTNRIVFHEITKPAILDAIEHPRHLDMNLVNAQQARRVLDRIVGFKLSPVLWRKVKPALSAGRVQSVAVRLIVEREREVQKFKSEPYFRVNAIFALINESGNATEVKAELDKHFKTQEEVDAFLEKCMDAQFIFVAALHMSVDGVAIATVLSNAVSAAILWGFLLKTDKVIRLEPKKLRIDGLCLKQILRIGVPAGVQSAMFSIANIVIQGAINSLGTVVMAASSAAYNIEVITYDILNSFSQACTTFVGQNFGAGEIKRCKKTLLLCLLEGIISLGVAIALILFFGKSLLTIFNGDPQVVETGYIRLMLIMPSHLFSLCYEVLSGYLRGFEISRPPAVLTMLGVCGVRLSWLRWVFPQYKTFMNIMLVFPISLATTALLMLAAVLYFRPSRRYAHLQKSDGATSAKIEG